MISLLVPYPALLVKSKESTTLVIADIHIGWEVALSKKGIYIPSQTSRLLNKLNEIVAKYKPQRLLILGDVKDTVATAMTPEWQDVPDFFCEVRKNIPDITIIRGNHDGTLEPLLPENVKILPSTGVSVGHVGFFHGHTWPSISLLARKTLVMGHVHPVVSFRDASGFKTTRQIWVKAHCDGAKLARFLVQKHRVKVEKTIEETLRSRYGIEARTDRLFIMPSFNDFLGGRPLNERWCANRVKARMFFGAVLRSEAVNMDDAETYLLDGTYLGTLEQVKNLS